MRKILADKVNESVLKMEVKITICLGHLTVVKTIAPGGIGNAWRFLPATCRCHLLASKFCLADCPVSYTAETPK
jgi:hypothetical protein